MLCQRGEGRAWGGDLIVFVGPVVGHLTDLVLPREGIFESFFARIGHMFPLPRFTHAPYGLKRSGNENKRKLSGFHCFVFKFRIMCFSVFLIN